MKISVDIDCTPDEARRFLGLPDIAPLQAAMMADIEERMRKAVQAMEPEAIFKHFLNNGFQAGVQGGVQNLAELQKAFWAQFNTLKPASKSE